MCQSLILEVQSDEIGRLTERVDRVVEARALQVFPERGDGVTQRDGGIQTCPSQEYSEFARHRTPVSSLENPKLVGGRELTTLSALENFRVAWSQPKLVSLTTTFDPIEGGNRQEL